MFDPSVSIYTTMILSNLTMGINDQSYQCGPLYITVDSNETILLNWDFKYCDSGKHPDTIKLYTFNERREIIEEIVETKGIWRSYHKSNQTFPVPMDHFPNGWNRRDLSTTGKAPCLPYIIESIRKNKVVDRRCFRIYPKWMQNFGNLRIGEMLIPGTHNSGAWKTKVILFTDYILNQDRNLYEQLVFGQRYFDIRVGIISEKEIFITHNIITVSRLDEELDNIVKFLEKSPKEIIIFDLHKFNIPLVFTKQHHMQVIQLLQEKIGKYMAPRSLAGNHTHGPKLEKFWESKKSIIVAYAAPEIVKTNELLWPAIHRDWGDKIDAEELKNYMVSVVRAKHRGNPMQVLMAELTPNAGHIARVQGSGLGKLADMVNQNLTHWMKDYGMESRTNLIASDYFLGNRLVEFAIGVNSVKVYSKKSNKH